MTQEQYENWRDFALRMARTAYRKNRRPSPEWIEMVVGDFFDQNSNPDWFADVVDWDETENSDEYDSPYVCDAVDELLCLYFDGFYVEGKDEKAIKENQEKAFEQWDEQWCKPVRCCLRAGLDLASSPSAGVLGFTAGDIRAMYPEGVPDWIKSGWRDRDGNKLEFDKIADEESLML